MKLLLFATTFLAATAIATAAISSVATVEDRLRDVQTELKTQGFFYGEADGKDTPETSAAIRRYQIRNGLQVTGKLNDETLAALGLAAKPAAKQPPAQVNPPPSTEQSPSKIQRGPGPDAEVPRARPQIPPEDPSIIPPPRPLPPATNDDFSAIFRGTPYANAPREVQLDVLRKAQMQLGRRGFYTAPPNGLPGPATSEAVSLYQEKRHLTRTGRLDLQTLSALGLLPGRSPDAPPLKPFYNPARRHDRSVDYDSMHRL